MRVLCITLKRHLSMHLVQFSCSFCSTWGELCGIALFSTYANMELDMLPHGVLLPFWFPLRSSPVICEPKVMDSESLGGPLVWV